jgi:regulator of sigma E protease
LLGGVVIALVLAKWTLLIAVLGLAFLITVHEFGHFLFAKLFGMRVDKFYVGFPPAAWKRRRGETEYGIGLIPLGGFCKISGMTQDEELLSQGGLLEKTLNSAGAELGWVTDGADHPAIRGQEYLVVVRLGGDDGPHAPASITGYQYDSDEAAAHAAWLRAAQDRGRPAPEGPLGAHLHVTTHEERGTVAASVAWRRNNLAFRVSATSPLSPAARLGAQAPVAGDGAAGTDPAMAENGSAALDQATQQAVARALSLASRVDARIAAAGLGDPLGTRVYYNQPVWKRNLTIFAGPFFNVVIAVVILFVALLAQGVVSPTLKLDEVAATVKVGNATIQTPAAAIGLQKGDTLIGAKAAGQPGPIPHWTQWAQASQFLQSHRDQTIDLLYRTAGGATRTATVKLISNPSAPSEGFLGVVAGTQTIRPAPWTAVWLAVKDTGGVVKSTFQGFYWLATGKVSVTGSNGAAGPVGIISLSSSAVQQGFYPILLALLSVNLGILNLIPILPFDGGHIFFATLERLRGRRVSARVMERAAAVGVALLLFLFVFLTYNDIRRLFGG